MLNLPAELEEAIEGEWRQGETRRIIHLERTDGSNCSKGKDAAMAIIRHADGWCFTCFRCGFSGFAGDRRRSADEIKAVLEGLVQEKEYESIPYLELPPDFKPMRGYPDSEGIPFAAYNWFWQYSLTEADIQRFNIGYSNTYRRVIIPIYEYAVLGVHLSKKLVGWIGRCPLAMTKETRKETKRTKYLTRKSSLHKRVFFHAPAESNTYVIVEDVLSAIKIQRACNVNAIALLTTHIPNSLLLKLNDKTVYIWLDADQLANMMAVIGKANALGVKCRYIHTTKDPKTYNDVAIRDLIKERK